MVPPGERTGKVHAIKTPNANLKKSANYDVSAEGSRKLLHNREM
jgi:hypothetical protein